MKIVASLIALALAVPAGAQSLAVVHAQAWTMEGTEPVSDATILIEDGRILSVTPAGPVPEGVPRIEARGRPVTPGLVNGATQIGLVDLEMHDDRSTDERSPSYDPSRALNGHSTLVSLARADGLTRALVYPSPSPGGPVSGEPVLVRLRDGVDILDRAQVAAYAVIGGESSGKSGGRAQQWAALHRGLAEARSSVPQRTKSSSPKRQRGDWSPTGAPPTTQNILRDVAAGKLPLAIETHRESDIRQALALASEYDIRLIIVGGSEAWRIADALAAADIPVIVDPHANLPSNFDELGARQDNAALLVDAGVRIAFGQTGGRRIPATYNAGMSLREGAGIAVAHGLSYIDALRAVTVRPLEIWGLGGGTLTPDADADLVVWDGDPLEPSSNADVVIVEGRVAPSRSRQDLLAERYLDVRR